MVVLIFESVYEFLWCYHSNTTSLKVLSFDRTCFQYLTILSIFIYLG